jgi:hypothetical protein
MEDLQFPSVSKQQGINGQEGFSHRWEVVEVHHSHLSQVYI